MTTKIGLVAGAALALATACATTPDTPAEQRGLQASASATLTTMTDREPGLRSALDDAYAYVVFPEIAKGGVIVGGAHGIGVVYRQGRPVGYADLNQASIGALLGGQSFAEVIILQNHQAYDRLLADDFDLGADASAVVINTGKGASLRFDRGVAVVVMPRTGLMVDLSVHGQQIDFQGPPSG
ncbi:MAG TPA: lipid-binding SYLF domain-containing protein [Kofleriaceae bacterium]|nr:lipid-binding SYLF domain-containing protein [Kofleriaceae bacterium]